MRQLEQAERYLRKAAQDERLAGLLVGWHEIGDDMFGFYANQRDAERPR